MDAAQAHAEALSILRSRLRAFRSELPRGAARHKWRLAYPRAYAPLIDEVAKERTQASRFCVRYPEPKLR